MSEPTKKPSPGLMELIGRAITDETFRTQLSEDRNTAVKDYHLSPADLEALDSISDEMIEEHARQFGAGSPAAMAVKVVVTKSF